MHFLFCRVTVSLSVLVTVQTVFFSFTVWSEIKLHQVLWISHFACGTKFFTFSVPSYLLAELRFTCNVSLTAARSLSSHFSEW